jgi:hypothetical protein
MKDKRLMYLLLPVTLLIWGAIFFKVAGTLSEKENNTPSFTERPEKKVKNLPDSFSLHLSYPDPFLKGAIFYEKTFPGQQTLPVKPRISAPTAIPPPGKKPGEPFQPPVFYAGMLENGLGRNKVKIALLRIGDKSLMLREKQQEGNLQVMKVWRDSVWIKISNQKSCIRK